MQQAGFENIVFTEADVPSTPVVPSVPQRLMSLDALRGFDMFWIIGADALVEALDRMMEKGGHAPGILGFITRQLEHAEWQGFHFEDLIFPLFVFMAGISVVFSLKKTIQREGRTEAVKRVFRRGILLYIVGIFYYGGFGNNWPAIRLVGVLNRIALAYFFAGLMFCFFSLRGMIVAAVSILIVYWALLTFVPIRNIQLDKGVLEEVALKRNLPMADAKTLFYGTTERVTGHYEAGLNLANHIDFQYLPGRLWDTYYDPEGLLSTLPAIVTCLLGVFAGLFLLNSSYNDQQKVVCLLAAGLALTALGWAWSAEFPVIKKIWTSSYVLVAGGYSAVLLGLFYWMVDVCKWQKWCQPFVWMGMNSITIYLTVNILGGFGKLSKRFVGGNIEDALNAHFAGLGDLGVAVVGLILTFWFAHFLYRRKIFLRL